MDVTRSVHGESAGKGTTVHLLDTTKFVIEFTSGSQMPVRFLDLWNVLEIDAKASRGPRRLLRVRGRRMSLGAWGAVPTERHSSRYPVCDSWCIHLPRAPQNCPTDRASPPAGALPSLEGAAFVGCRSPLAASLHPLIPPAYCAPKSGSRGCSVPSTPRHIDMAATGVISLCSYSCSCMAGHH